MALTGLNRLPKNKLKKKGNEIKMRGRGGKACVGECTWEVRWEVGGEYDQDTLYRCIKMSKNK